MKEQVRRLAAPFSSSSWPALECPACRTGTLSAISGDIRRHAPNAETRQWEEWGDPTDIKGTFYGHLTCSYPECGDVVAVAGDVSVDHNPESYESDYSDWFRELIQVRTLYPPIRVVDSPSGTPDSVDNALVDASAIAWQNPSAGTALLRTSIERLMDELGIVATFQNGKPRPLHDRLLEFEKINRDAATPLIASKWVGNQGTHGNTSTGLTISDFLDVAEFVEMALDVLYQKDTTAIRQRIQRIVTARRLVP